MLTFCVFSVATQRILIGRVAIFVSLAVLLLTTVPLSSKNMSLTIPTLHRNLQQFRRASCLEAIDVQPACPVFIWYPRCPLQLVLPVCSEVWEQVIDRQRIC